MDKTYELPQNEILFFLISRQEDRDGEHESSNVDMLEKLSRMSINDASLADWHLGFHISLVYKSVFYTMLFLLESIFLITVTVLDCRHMWVTV